jgi:hypothetical protein
MSRYPKDSFLNRHPLLVGAVAGLVAGAASGASDRLLDRLVSDSQKRRERRVRRGSAHEVAGPYLAQKLMGRRLSRRGAQRARAVFNVLYGVGWGMLHSRLRRSFPKLSRLMGLPFAVPFFFACDGFIAPRLGITPRLTRIPWQPSAKELGNHITWTAVCEAIHRWAARRR